MKLVAVLLLLAIGCGGKHIAPATAPEPTPSVEAFMALVREAALARPRPVLETIEQHDSDLAEALTLAASQPSPATYRSVAREYRRLRVTDRAHDYLGLALRLDETDAATYDAIARLWRDSGFPNLGLVEAYRAIFYAPQSASARNTLGTLLQAMGQRDLARAEYQRAIDLDPAAAYAFNNLCYAWVLDGDAARATAACEQALKIQPDFAAARNNLGLAHAVAGRMADSRKAFAAAGDPAAALYNTGMVLLAHRQYTSAVEAFQAAHTLRPSHRAALARVRQARAAAAASARVED